MENPYQAPASRVEDPSPQGPQLAGRGERFGASLIDGLIAMAVILPLEFATGFWQEAMNAAHAGQPLSVGTLMTWALIGAVIFVLIQGYPLVNSGQTWGKKACSIRIVDMSGNKPGIGSLCIRYGLMNLAGQVSWVGKIFIFVDLLMIFREDRRCAHDLAAGTRVVKV